KPSEPPEPPAKAQAREPERKVAQRREALFKEGQKLVEQEQWREALDRFREVQRLRAHPRVLLWMAYCVEHLGQVLKARAIYAQALADAQEAKLADVEGDATRSLAEISAKIPHIVFRGF